jgi:hypothetical protein
LSQKFCSNETNSLKILPAAAAAAAVVNYVAISGDRNVIKKETEKTKTQIPYNRNTAHMGSENKSE